MTASARPPAVVRVAQRRSLFGPVALLIALSLAVFANSLPGYFVSDDFVLREAAPASFADLPRFLLGDVQGRRHIGVSYRPVVSLSFALDRADWGERPAGYHLTNILLHCGVTLLVLALIAAALGKLGADARGLAGRLAAFAGAAWFCLQPTRAESVAWISGRTDLLCALFYAAAFLAFLRWTARPRPLAYAGALLAFFLALGSKELAVSFPLLAFAYVAVFGYGSGRRGLRAGFAATWPFWLLLAGYFVLRRCALASFVGGYETEPALFLLKARSGLAHHLFQLWQPFGLGLEALRLPAYSLHLEALFTLLLGLWAWRIRSRLAAVGFLWLGVSLLPILNQSGERLIYLPSIGFAIVLAAFLIWLAGWRPRRRPMGAIAAVVLMVAWLAGSAVSVRAKNHDWVEAGNLTRQLLTQTRLSLPRPAASTVFTYAVLPDALGTTWVFRNGIAEAIRLVYRDSSLSAVCLSRVYLPPGGDSGVYSVISPAGINVRPVGETYFVEPRAVDSPYGVVRYHRDGESIVAVIEPRRPQSTPVEVLTMLGRSVVPAYGGWPQERP